MRKPAALPPPSCQAAAAATPSTPPPAAPNRSRLAPGHWISAATEVLVDRGIDHVRVDLLASSLGVTRGSFYWHFRDREDLLRRVLQAWRERATVQLTERLGHAQADPREQLRDVLSLPHRGRAAHKAARIELALRAWARRDTTARQAVDEADAARLDYITAVLVALGVPAEAAAARAFVVYSLVVAESLVSGPGGAAGLVARRQVIEQLLLR